MTTQNSEILKNACVVAGIPVTKRQASKFNNSHGAAHRMLAYLGQHGVKHWFENIESGNFNPDELREVRSRANS